MTPPPIWGTPARTLNVAVERIAHDVRPGAAPTSDAITVETLQAVRANGRGVVLGVELPTAGPARLTAGQLVHVGWKRGRPVVILAGKVRRAQFPDVSEGGAAGGVVEELFIALSPLTGLVDVWFRNDQQVTNLNIRSVLPADPEYVKWGSRGDAFFVRTPTHRYHVFSLNRTVDVAIGAAPVTATFVRTDSPGVTDLPLVTVTITKTNDGTEHDIQFEVVTTGTDDQGNPIYAATPTEKLYGSQSAITVTRTIPLRTAFLATDSGNPFGGEEILEALLDDRRHLLLLLRAQIGSLAQQVDPLPPSIIGTLERVVGTETPPTAEVGFAIPCAFATTIGSITGPGISTPILGKPLFLVDVTAGLVLWRSCEDPVTLTIVQGDEASGFALNRLDGGVAVPPCDALSLRALSGANSQAIAPDMYPSFRIMSRENWDPQVAAGNDGFTPLGASFLDVTLTSGPKSFTVTGAMNRTDLPFLPAPSAWGVSPTAPETVFDRVWFMARHPKSAFPCGGTPPTGFIYVEPQTPPNCQIILLPETASTPLNQQRFVPSTPLHYIHRRRTTAFVEPPTFRFLGMYVPRRMSVNQAGQLTGSPLGVLYLSVNEHTTSGPARDRMGIFAFDLQSRQLITLEPLTDFDPVVAVSDVFAGWPASAPLSANAHHLLWRARSGVAGPGVPTHERDEILLYDRERNTKRLVLGETNPVYTPFDPTSISGVPFLDPPPVEKAELIHLLNRHLVLLLPDFLYWPEDVAGGNIFVQGWDRSTGALTLEVTAATQPPADTVLATAGRLAALPAGVVPRAARQAMWIFNNLGTPTVHEAANTPAVEPIPGPSVQVVNDPTILGPLGRYQTS